MNRYVLYWPPKPKIAEPLDELDALRLMSDVQIFDEVGEVIRGTSSYYKVNVYTVARERGINNIKDGKAPPPPPPPLLY